MVAIHDGRSALFLGIRSRPKTQHPSHSVNWIPPTRPGPHIELPRIRGEVYAPAFARRGTDAAYCATPTLIAGTWPAFLLKLITPPPARMYPENTSLLP